MADAAYETPKSELVKLKGRFTPEAKQRISEFLESIETYEATLGLLYGDLDGKVAGEASWSITAFDPLTVEDTVAMYAGVGAVVCYELDGFRVMVPQMSHIAELDAGVLDFIHNRLRPASSSGG
jgi:hypothetical protein